MSAPKRIQRKRTAGWRMPEGAVYVGRPAMFGNPFTLEGAREMAARDGFWEPADVDLRRYAVTSFRLALAAGRLGYTDADVRRALAGRDLACWCPLDQPCHADVLLEVANS